MKALPPDFYARPTLDVVRDVIGKVLVHTTRGRRTAGIIVEAEAYIGETDPACHAAAGRTARTEPLYGPPGRAYVYFTYGMHHLVNAVTEREGFPAAVLIRALDPIEGEDVMRRRRRARRQARGMRSAPIAAAELCRGPANLTVALGIDLRQNRLDLTGSALQIEDHGVRGVALDWSRRIGIRVGTEPLWRCAWRGHAAVSGPTDRFLAPSFAARARRPTAVGPDGCS